MEATASVPLRYRSGARDGLCVEAFTLASGTRGLRGRPVRVTSWVYSQALSATAARLGGELLGVSARDSRKDAAMLSECPEPDVRRLWPQRVIDHDGVEEGSRGIEMWFRLGKRSAVPRDE